MDCYRNQWADLSKVYWLLLNYCEQITKAISSSLKGKVVCRWIIWLMWSCMLVLVIIYSLTCYKAQTWFQHGVRFVHFTFLPILFQPMYVPTLCAKTSNAFCGPLVQRSSALILVSCCPNPTCIPITME